MYRYFIFFVLLFFIFQPLRAQQYSVSGRVSDSASGEPLAFVNIVMNQGKYGGMSDIDGRFDLTSKVPITLLSFSYVGYEPLMLQVKGINFQVKLTKTAIDLTEVLIEAGENPAHRIIHNAIQNRAKNDPRNIKSYSYTSYDKMIFTLNPDSIMEGSSLQPDSLTEKMLRTIERQHLFMMESVAEHQYLYPDQGQDKIIATRIAGMKDPLFVFLMSNMQSTSFYDEMIAIGSTRFLNPLSPNSKKSYFFALRDTLFSDIAGDTTYVIAYKPRPGKNFDGLTGLLYISNQGWAISNVIAEPARQDEKLGIRIQQMYQQIDGKQWFPVQLNTDITFKNFPLPKAKPVGIGKSYRQNIVLNAEVNKRNIGNVAVDVLPNASRQNEVVWNKYRVDTLTIREKNTYRVIDSLGKANHLDQKAKGFAAMVSGRLPLGYLEMDLNRLFRYSKYEGLYLGIGLHTSDRMSHVVKTGGYWGYGFRDESAKFGADVSVKLQRQGKSKITLSYADDLEESAGTWFFDDDKQSFNQLNFRDFYVELMDRSKTARVLWSFSLPRSFEAGISLSREEKHTTYDYAFRQGDPNIGILTNHHTFGKIGLGLKFAPGQKFIRNSDSRLPIGNPNPVIWLQYTSSRAGFLEGQFNYNRLDLKMKWSHFTRGIGESMVWLKFGLIDKAAPLSEMINGQGSAGDGFSLWAPASFSTMPPGEFVSDRFAAVFLSHNFGNLLFRRPKFQPEPSVVLNYAVGSLADPEIHRFANFKTMEKGYLETGLVVENIIRTAFSGLGLGLFYRAGAYSNSNIGKNFMGRLSFSLNL